MPEAAGRAARAAAADRRAGRGDGHARRLGRRAGAAADAAVRRHRQRQDRGLPARWPSRRCAAGKQALVLVPEINLTPQLEQRFAARFPGRRLVSLHSALTPAQRLQHWLSAHLGEADLVLGTRLAVFASLPRLGLIVVDEEHDPSYKQQDGARYSARDLAVYRGHLAQRAGAARLGDAVARDLVARADRPLPAGDAAGARRRAARCPRCAWWTWPPCRAPRRARRRRRCAPQLVDAIQQRVARGEQTLVFLNRRGFAPVLHCPALHAGRAAARTAAPGACSTRASASCAATTAARRSRCRAPAPTAATSTSSRWAAAPSGWRSRSPSCCPARACCASTPTPRAPRARSSRSSASVHAGDVDVLVGTQMVDQGPRLPPRHAGGRGQSGQRAVRRRLPRARAPVRAADAGRRPRGTRRGHRARQRDVGADLQPGARAVRGAEEARLRRLRDDAAGRARSPPACRRTRTSRCCAPRRGPRTSPRPSCARRATSRKTLSRSRPT